MCVSNMLREMQLKLIAKQTRDVRAKILLRCLRLQLLLHYGPFTEVYCGSQAQLRCIHVQVYCGSQAQLRYLHVQVTAEVKYGFKVSTW